MKVSFSSVNLLHTTIKNVKCIEIPATTVRKLKVFYEKMFIKI